MNKKKQGNSTGNEVADKLYSQFEKHKEVSWLFLSRGSLNSMKHV